MLYILLYSQGMIESHQHQLLLVDKDTLHEICHIVLEFHGYYLVYMCQ